MTLRLSDEQAATLEVLARADGKGVSETIRAAIDRHIEERRNDKEFQSRLRRRMEEDKAILDRLAK